MLPVTATEIATWAIAAVAGIAVIGGGIALRVSKRRRQNETAAEHADDAADA